MLKKLDWVHPRMEELGMLLSDPAVVQDLSQRKLECDSECRIIQRNRQFAEALQVGPAAQDLPEEVSVRRGREA